MGRLAYLLPLLPLLGATPCVAAEGGETIHHRLRVALDPSHHRLVVEDRIQLPVPLSELEIDLHAGLEPRLQGTLGELHRVGGGDAAVPVERYRLSFPQPQREFGLTYQGEIDHPLGVQAEGFADRRGGTAGTISEAGVFLSGASYWYPQIAGRFVDFELEVELPEGWLSVSQGVIDEHNENLWREAAPQDEIYLVAGRYHLYRRPGPLAEAMVYLHDDDPALAQDYLDATERYLQRFSDLLGSYPYAKFATVENLWESGYGMPSFTLLGPRVMRLPFILESSFPHEILHNWWGNGVYVDYAGGNWSEGLTSYLADHRAKELAGQGAEYRRDTLQQYADYTREQGDFPLSAFTGRQGRHSQAVGYGKALMFFHMLRRHLGDEPFFAGLREFYRSNLHRVAGYAELRRAFESVSGTSLEAEFAQWVAGAGVPELSLDGINVERGEEGLRLSGRVGQRQPDRLFQLQVPLQIEFADGSRSRTEVIRLEGPEQPFDLPLEHPPSRVTLDPGYDLLRALAPGELPPRLAQLFTATGALLVLSEQEPSTLRPGYEGLAGRWAAGLAGIEVVGDSTLRQLPADRAVWLFGRSNRFVGEFLERLEGAPLRIDPQRLEIDGSGFPIEGSSFVLTVSGAPAIAWVVLGEAAAAPGLARKLPHYGKYGYLVFDGAEPTNRLKGQWPSGPSPLRVELPRGDD